MKKEVLQQEYDNLVSKYHMQIEQNNEGINAAIKEILDMFCRQC